MKRIVVIILLSVSLAATLSVLTVTLLNRTSLPLHDDTIMVQSWPGGPEHPTWGPSTDETIYQITPPVTQYSLSSGHAIPTVLGIVVNRKSQSVVGFVLSPIPVTTTP